MRQLGIPVVALALALALVGGLLPGAARAGGGFVGAQGRQFVDGAGRPFFVWGVNYVGAGDRAWAMWEDGRFDPALIGADFARARGAGAGVVRIFVRNPLPREIAAGRWTKLDTVLALAKQHGLRLLVTFHDYEERDLQKLAATIRAIAARYAAEAAIFGYDLQNEPHFSDLVSSTYPGGPPPLLGDALVKTYGERASQAQVNAWRLTAEARSVVPARLSEREAYYAANGYRIYQDFVGAIGRWVTARDYNGDALEYLATPEAARWKTLLAVLDGTLAAWLQPQLAALRAADRTHLVTVGYNDPVLAHLSANRALGFVSLHRFPNPGVKPLQVAIGTAQRLQRVFPDKPLLLEEFGYSDLDRGAAAVSIDESAFLLSVWSEGLAGALKWSLTDMVDGYNMRERSFGLYEPDGAAKPAAAGARALAEYFPSAGLRARLATADAGGSLTYTYSAPDALIVAGRQFQDPRLSFTAAAPIQVAVTWTERDVIAISTTGRATLTVNPRALLNDAGVRPEFALARGAGLAAPFDAHGETLSFAAEPGERYLLSLTHSAIDAKIEIVWPHGNLPVDRAERANVGAYLFQGGTGRAFCESPAVPVRLWGALNNGVERLLATGIPKQSSAGGAAFTAWDFNNLDVSAARDPANKYYFRLSVDGRESRSGVWSHGADARTYFPKPDVPAGVAEASPDAVDAKIEIVWPHGNLPVDRAERVNIAAYLFPHGTNLTVPLDWNGKVRLWRSLNNGIAEEVAVGQKTLRTAGSLAFPAWEFNNVDVGAARDALNKYYFRLTVDGAPTFSNIWSHGKDARTYFPKMDTPEGCA